jgi:hypothetical protein
MSTYLSIDSKAEDAVKAAFIAIGGTDWSDLSAALGFTVNQGGDPDEMATPCVNIYSAGPNPRDPLYAGKLADHYDVAITVEVRTSAEDTTRAQHASLFGLMQAIGIQSADQMVAALNAAAIPNFRATQWKHTGGSNDFAGQTRISSVTFSLICHHV